MPRIKSMVDTPGNSPELPFQLPATSKVLQTSITLPLTKAKGKFNELLLSHCVCKSNLIYISIYPLSLFTHLLTLFELRYLKKKKHSFHTKLKLHQHIYTIYIFCTVVPILFIIFTTFRTLPSPAFFSWYMFLCPRGKNNVNSYNPSNQKYIQMLKI